MKKYLLSLLLMFSISEILIANPAPASEYEYLAQSVRFRSQQRMKNSQGFMFYLYSNGQWEFFADNGEYLALGSWELKNGKIVLYDNRGLYITSCDCSHNGSKLFWMDYRGQRFNNVN